MKKIVPVISIVEIVVVVVIGIAVVIGEKGCPNPLIKIRNYIRNLLICGTIRWLLN
jgi:hypothetical protein